RSSWSPGKAWARGAPGASASRPWSRPRRRSPMRSSTPSACGSRACRSRPSGSGARSRPGPRACERTALPASPPLPPVGGEWGVAGRARLTLDAPTRGRPAALAPLVPLFGLDVLTAFTVGMVPPLLPLLATHWSLSPIAVGLVNTLYAIGRLGAAYPASRFRARHGTRAATFLGLAGLFVGSVACGLAPSFPLFLVARLLMGVGGSIAFLAIFAELLAVAPAGSRGR